MNGQERRERMITYILESEEPVSGTSLAKVFHVSRQVIVQDIALIRANGCDVISTNRGYVIHVPKTVRAVFYVNHTDGELEEELCAIVDMGGKVLNVIVEHDVYGRLEADLHITSRRGVQAFLEEMKNSNSGPLKNITSGNHAHLVEADDEKTLKWIEESLRQRGFLVKKEEGAHR